MPTLPTEAQILAADFLGDSLASWFAIARSYDDEVGGACAGRIEGALARLTREGYEITFVVLETGKGTDTVPEINGWRVSLFAQDHKYRVITVEARRDGVVYELRAAQVVQGPSRQFGGYDKGFRRTNIAAPAPV